MRIPPEEKFDEIFALVDDPDLAETGGGHGQKGVDFQRFWALVRMFELMEQGVDDFLLLFESVQDVAELDSETSPTTIRIFQVKKKDSGEWSFNLLTGLPKPDGRKKNAVVNPKAVQASPIGKLYRSSLAFKHLKSTAYFVSNAGCDLPLAASGTASKLLACCITDLDEAHAKAFSEALASIQDASGATPSLEKLQLWKTTLHPDNPVPLAVGTVATYLTKNYPAHAAQAKALVDALFMQISALGRRIEPATSFEEVRSQRGFSFSDLVKALKDLESTPDIKANLDDILDALVQEGLSPIRKIRLRTAATGYFSRLVSGTIGEKEIELIARCAELTEGIDWTDAILATIESYVPALSEEFSDFKADQILAHLLMQVIKHVTA